MLGFSLPLLTLWPLRVRSEVDSAVSMFPHTLYRESPSSHAPLAAGLQIPWER